MKLSEIKQKASQENIDTIDKNINQIKKVIDQNPLGSTLSLPPHLIPAIEEYCDKNYIPFYHVAESLCSVAKTYSALYAMEQQR